MNGGVRLASVVLLQVVLASSLAAQSVWLPPVAQGIGIEFARPFIENADLDPVSGTFFLFGAARLNERLALFAELPYSRVAADGGESGALGNLGIGLRFGEDEPRAELSVRLPTAEDEITLLVGFATDPDRVEAFVPDALAVRAAGWLRSRAEAALRVVARGNLTYVQPTDDGGEGELLLGYAGQLWHEREDLRLGAGLLGAAFLTAEGSLADRSTHQLGFMAEAAFGAVRPGVQLRFPLDSEIDVDAILGLSVQVELSARQ